MSTYDFLLLGMIVLSVCSLGLFVMRLSRFPERTIRDVRRFLRPVDSNILMELLDTRNEAFFSSRLTDRALRTEQVRNLHYAKEYMARMAHNAAILAEWANSELTLQLVGRPGEGAEEDYLRSARKLQIAASDFRLYALGSLWKIRFWLILRKAPWLSVVTPGIGQLRDIYGSQFRTLYGRLTEAVSELGVLYGREFHQELLSSL